MPQAAVPVLADPAWDAVFGASGADNTVRAIVADGSGNVYVAGSFTSIGGISASRIARWNGTEWSTVGSGLDDDVYALALDADGNLYAGGAFENAGGVAASHVAKWDGATWSALSAGLNNAVLAMDVDAGGRLYVGGQFTSAGSMTAYRVAMWDGSQWSTLGAGVNGTVWALDVDSAGNVYVGGMFSSAGSTLAAFVAEWNGASWLALGSGVNSTVYALAAHDGSVYAGGSFTMAGGASASGVARWTGAGWEMLGSGINDKVKALAVSGDGTLYAGGLFTTAGGVSASNIAVWDGGAWAGLGAGANDEVHTLASATSLYVGGAFSTAGGNTSEHIARWGAEPGAEGSISTGAVPILPVAGLDQVAPGQSLTVSVNVGSEAEPVTGLFGVGFKLHFDPAVFQASAPEAGSLLSTGTAGDIITFENVDNINGIAAISVTRKQGLAAVDGYGTVASITLTALPEAASGTVTLSLTDVLGVDAAGDSIALAAADGQVEVAGALVWPGDTDDDGDVDISDVLPVGIHFGLTGPAREDASLAWQAQPVQPWTPNDAAYADATGDGLISQNDVLPVGLSFGSTRGASKTRPLSAHAGPLAMLSVPALSQGQQFSVEILLGNSVETVEHVLGVAAELDVPPTLKVLDVQAGEWIDNGDLLGLSRPDGGRFHVAFTRKRMAGAVSGYGSVVALTIEVTEPMHEPAELALGALSLGTPMGVRPVGADIPVALESSIGTSTEEHLPVAFELYGAYPNPFNPTTTLTFDLPETAQVTVYVYDMLGREVQRMEAGMVGAGRSRRILFEAGGMPSGSYVYRVQAQMGKTTEFRTGRFVLVK